jgi:hypothetical protein
MCDHADILRVVFLEEYLRNFGLNDEHIVNRDNTFFISNFRWTVTDSISIMQNLLEASLLVAPEKTYELVSKMAKGNIHVQDEFVYKIGNLHILCIDRPEVSETLAKIMEQNIIIVLGCKVRTIREFAFVGCFGIKTIIIPNSVTSIEKYAFSGCFGLGSIKIPDSITVIEPYTFSGCFGLKSVYINDFVTSIGDYAFQGCFGLKSVEIPLSATIIGCNAFAYCSGLENVKINGVDTIIGSSAFRSCQSNILDYTRR